MQLFDDRPYRDYEYDTQIRSRRAIARCQCDHDSPGAYPCPGALVCPNSGYDDEQDDD